MGEHEQQHERQHERGERPAAREADPTAAGVQAANPLLAQQQARGNQAVQRRLRDGALPPRLILGQQGTLGNQAVQRLLQAKLTVTPPGDAYEQEAEAVADQVMRLPEPAAAPAEPSAPEPLPAVVQRHAAPDEEPVQRQAEEAAAPALDPALEERIAGLQGGGQPLAAGERAFFEPRFGHDFTAVRLHTSGEAAALARAVDARAFTVGSTIAFAAGEYAPDSAAGRHLLAHELTHVVQQTGGQTAVARQPAGLRTAGMVVQRHASWEHRALGDARPHDLEAIASRIDPQHRQHVLEEERNRLQLWRRDPDSVTREQVQATWPEVRVLTLRNGLVVTYGELNTLGDYLSSPEAIESAPREVTRSLLQTVRQQSFNRLTDMLGVQDVIPTPDGPPVSMPAYRHFPGAVGPVGGHGTLAAISEVNALNELTGGLGADQYQALVARNACHFAPFNWNRWEEFHTQARALAQLAHQQGSEEMARRAWINNGYADHFLQDAFAAGHLINKTLIMQWFVEWVEDHNARSRWDRLFSSNRSMWNIDLENWDQIRTMTTARQPGLAGRHLYQGPRGIGQSADPQTAEDQSDLQERMNVSGVQAEGGLTQEEAYRNYLAFLNSSAVQAASGAVHDYFNERSLWVSSPAHRDAYQIWGDETMLQGGEGVRIAAETAQMSQQAIDDLVRTGQTAIATQQIRDRFPNRVRAEDGSRMLPLEEWNESLRTLCWETIFPEVHYRIIDSIRPQMGEVSRDLRRRLAPPPPPAPTEEIPDAGVPIAGVPD